MNNKELHELIYNYPTKHKWGFIQPELQEILTKFPQINMSKYNNAMMGNTCMYDQNDGLITYHCDVLTALKCGIQNREMKIDEFD